MWSLKQNRKQSVFISSMHNNINLFHQTEIFFMSVKTKPISSVICWNVLLSWLHPLNWWKHYNSPWKKMCWKELQIDLRTKTFYDYVHERKWNEQCLMAQQHLLDHVGLDKQLVNHAYRMRNEGRLPTGVNEVPVMQACPGLMRTLTNSANPRSIGHKKNLILRYFHMLSNVHALYQTRISQMWEP